MVAAPIGQAIDPYANGRSGIDELAWLYGDGLVGWNDGPTPLLAELPAVSADGREYRYRLRPAIWHDRSPVRASDVKAAWDLVKNTSWHYSLPYSAVNDVVAISERDLVVKLNVPLRGFARSFFGPYGTPALPVLRHTGESLPIGTGPFVLRRRSDPGRWALERWQSSPRGTPRLDAIDLRVVPLDSTVAVQIESGEADLAYPLPSRERYPGLKRFDVHRRVTSIVFLIFNTEGALNTSSLRRAFAGALDLRRLQHTFDEDLAGLFTAYTMTGWSDGAFRGSVTRSPSASRTIHDTARHRPLRVVYLSGNPRYETVANVLQQDLGGETVVEQRRFPIAVLLAPEGPLWKGAFDVAIVGLPYGDDPDLAPAWGCVNRAPHGANISRWCDAAFESALARHDVGAALRRMVDELVCIPLGPAREDIGVDQRVQGFHAPPPLVPLTYGCTQWSLAH